MATVWEVPRTTRDDSSYQRARWVRPQRPLDAGDCVDAVHKVESVDETDHDHDRGAACGRHPQSVNDSWHSQQDRHQRHDHLGEESGQWRDTYEILQEAKYSEQHYG